MSPVCDVCKNECEWTVVLEIWDKDCHASIHERIKRKEEKIVGGFHLKC